MSCMCGEIPTDSNIPWIAPKWLTEGDFQFFYHTNRLKVKTLLVRFYKGVEK